MKKLIVISDIERKMKDALQASKNAKDKLLREKQSDKILNTKLSDLEDRIT